MSFFKDPLLYVNWGAAIIAIYFIRVGGKEIEKTKSPQLVLVYLILLSIAVGGCLYISTKAGDLQLFHMGIKP